MADESPYDERVARHPNEIRVYTVRDRRTGCSARFYTVAGSRECEVIDEMVKASGFKAGWYPHTADVIPVLVRGELARIRARGERTCACGMPGASPCWREGGDAECVSMTGRPHA